MRGGSDMNLFERPFCHGPFQFMERVARLDQGLVARNESQDAASGVRVRVRVKTRVRVRVRVRGVKIRLLGWAKPGSAADSGC